MRSKTLTKKEYCSTVCGAKCCIIHYDGVELMPCPKLDQDNLCTIYKERYEEKKPYSFTKALPYNGKLLVLKMDCGNIKDVLKGNGLPDHVKKQCCYYNPKLLKVHNA